MLSYHDEDNTYSQTSLRYVKIILRMYRLSSVEATSAAYEKMKFHFNSC